mgnify:CR=1 FL=1
MAFIGIEQPGYKCTVPVFTTFYLQYIEYGGLIVIRVEFLIGRVVVEFDYIVFYF